MIKIAPPIAEAAIIKAVEEVNEKFKLGSVITEDYCPGVLIRSQVLLTIMGRIGRALEITIPENVYIFFDKVRNKQLSIKEAAQKLISKATPNGK